MNTLLSARRWIAGTVGVLTACATAVAVSTPAAHAASNSTTFIPSVQRLAVAALSHSAGISTDQALRVLSQQPAHKALLARLARQLGNRTAGTFLDPKPARPW